MRHVQDVGLGYGDKELRGKVSVSHCYQPDRRVSKKVCSSLAIFNKENGENFNGIVSGENTKLLSDGFLDLRFRSFRAT